MPEYTPLENLAYVNLKCWQAKEAGIYNSVEIKCLWEALDKIHEVLLKNELNKE